MKKNKKVLIILLTLVSFISIIQIKIVNADSGWDTSYSSSSSSSSSSFSSDYSYSSSSSGESRPLTEQDWIIIIVIFIAITVGYILHVTIFRPIFLKIDGYLDKKIDQISKLKFKKYKEVSNEELGKYINISNEELKKILFKKFVDIQNSWMNFDYESLRKLCDNKLYNMYYEELEALKLKGNKNVMSNFIKLEDKIIDVKKENDIVIIKYYLDVKFYDYIVSSHNITIKGTENKMVNNIYMLEFILNSKKVADTCPNCGGKIESGTIECSHCKAIIVQDSNEFVLSNKRKLKQY